MTVSELSRLVSAERSLDAAYFTSMIPSELDPREIQAFLHQGPFNPLNLSNKNVVFLNAPNLGVVVAHGRNSQEISLNDILKYQRRQAFGIQGITAYYGGDYARQQVAIRVKYLYVMKNLMAMNRIIQEKNEILIQNFEEPSDAMRFLAWLISCISIGWFQSEALLDDWGYVLHLSPQFSNAQPTDYPLFVGENLADAWVQKMREFDPDFYDSLDSIAFRDIADKEERLIRAIESFFEAPERPLEDFLVVHSPRPGYSLDELYRANFPGGSWGVFMHGHLLDENP